MPRMGNWKTRAMVQRYAHLADEELRRASAKLAQLVGQHPGKQEDGKGVGKDGSDRTGSA